jgi:molybdopterin molybdotransferase
MISVKEVDAILENHLYSPEIEQVNLEDSLGRVTATDVIADRDFPPFNRVAMDGICVRLTDLESGMRSFPIHGVQAAGEPQMTLPNEAALEIMTGASLPHHADVVIRYEDVTIKGGIAHVNVDSFRHYQNVHDQGSDRKKGEVVLPKASVIRPAEIGVLATVGAIEVDVIKLPRVAIISTGDELVEVNKTPLPHQIRKSNVHTLHTELLSHQIKADLVHLNDDKAVIEQRLSDIITEYDVVLMSGAVSKGKFDFLPEILEKLGVQKQFHRVAQRPGKPFWFGGTNTCTVFAFPGNPVSTYACMLRYFVPWLRLSLGKPVQPEFAQLSTEFAFRPGLTYFLQVAVENRNGSLVATPVQGNGSGDLVNLTNANGFLELPADQTDFPAGEVYPVWRF